MDQYQINQALTALLASDPNATKQDVINAAATYGITPDQVATAYQMQGVTADQINQAYADQRALGATDEQINTMANNLGLTEQNIFDARSAYYGTPDGQAYLSGFSDPLQADWARTFLTGDFAGAQNLLDTNQLSSSSLINQYNVNPTEISAVGDRYGVYPYGETPPTTGGTGGTGGLSGAGGTGGLPDNWNNGWSGTSAAPVYGYSGGASADMQNMTNAIQGQIGSNVQAPNPLGTVGGIDLTSAYNRYINGDAGANPYLTGALQRGADQATNTYQQMLRDQAQTFNEQIMPSIRNGAVATGGIGGARQGIAEGIAGREFGETTSRLAQQLGQDVNSAMIGGQANAWMQGNQLGANLANNLSQQNVYGQLNTNALNQGAINAGINNQQNWFNTATSLAGAQDAYQMNRLGSAANMMNPYGAYTSTQQFTSPLYNNPWSSMLGGGMAGAQIGNLVF